MIKYTFFFPKVEYYYITILCLCLSYITGLKHIQVSSETDSCCAECTAAPAFPHFANHEKPTMKFRLSLLHDVSNRIINSSKSQIAYKTGGEESIDFSDWKRTVAAFMVPCLDGTLAPASSKYTDFEQTVRPFRIRRTILCKTATSAVNSPWALSGSLWSLILKYKHTVINRKPK